MGWLHLEGSSFGIFYCIMYIISQLVLPCDIVNAYIQALKRLFRDVRDSFIFKSQHMFVADHQIACRLLFAKRIAKHKRDVQCKTSTWRGQKKTHLDPSRRLSVRLFVRLSVVPIVAPLPFEVRSTLKIWLQYIAQCKLCRVWSVNDGIQNVLCYDIGACAIIEKQNLDIFIANTPAYVRTKVMQIPRIFCRCKHATLGGPCVDPIPQTPVRTGDTGSCVLQWQLHHMFSRSRGVTERDEHMLQPNSFPLLLTLHSLILLN